MHNESGGKDWTKQETYGLKDVPEDALFLAGLIQHINSIEEATNFLGYLESLFLRGQINSIKMRDLTNELDGRVISMVRDTAILKSESPRLKAYRERLLTFTQLTSIEIEQEVISVLDHKIGELGEEEA